MLLIGYGSTEFGSPFSNKLKIGKATGISNSQCASMYNEADLITSDEMCAVSTAGRDDTCEVIAFQKWPENSNFS